MVEKDTTQEVKIQRYIRKIACEGNTQYAVKLAALSDEAILVVMKSDPLGKNSLRIA